MTVSSCCVTAGGKLFLNDSATGKETAKEADAIETIHEKVIRSDGIETEPSTFLTIPLIISSQSKWWKFKDSTNITKFERATDLNKF